MVEVLKKRPLYPSNVTTKLVAPMVFVFQKVEMKKTSHSVSVARAFLDFAAKFLRMSKLETYSGRKRKGRKAERNLTQMFQKKRELKKVKRSPRGKMMKSAPSHL